MPSKKPNTASKKTPPPLQSLVSPLSSTGKKQRSNSPFEDEKKEEADDRANSQLNMIHVSAGKDLGNMQHNTPEATNKSVAGGEPNELTNTELGRGKRDRKIPNNFTFPDETPKPRKRPGSATKTSSSQKKARKSRK